MKTGSGSRLGIAVAVAAAIAFGLAVGTYEIANTSFGWHLAAGRSILEGQGIPHSDPFSFTNQGAEWVDHEWLFQVLLAAVERSGGEVALVGLRAVLVTAFVLMILFFCLRSGLSPPVAMLFTALCTYGARIRFYLRPELFTLLIVPLGLYIFLHRREPGWRRAAPLLLVLLMVLGINCHGAVLVLPILLAGVLAAELLATRGDRSRLRDSVLPGSAVVAAVAAAGLVSPFGWKVFVVPFKLAHLVSLPQIPNPEWISPSPTDLPSLYVALGLGLLILMVGERDLRRWMLFFLGAALALRYVRNVGLFFAILPLVTAPALAKLPAFANHPAAEGGRRRTINLLAYTLVVALAATIIVDPRHVLHPGLSTTRYPARACEFMEAEALITGPMYNDVRFGGYLIQRYFPPKQVFIDDRNEIHEPLLTEIYEILQASDVRAWQRMLQRYEIETALIRYNAGFVVQSPDGVEIGLRGFSALWFPAESWALVYWDDTAMVLVKRATASPELLIRCEYQLIRPDDLDHLRRRIASEPEIRLAVAAELQRKLREEPTNSRARELFHFLTTGRQVAPP